MIVKIRRQVADSQSTFWIQFGIADPCIYVRMVIFKLFSSSAMHMVEGFLILAWVAAQAEEEIRIHASISGL